MHDDHAKSSFETSRTLSSSASPSSSLSSLVSSNSMRPAAPYSSSQSDLGTDSCDSELSSTEYKQSLSPQIAGAVSPNPPRTSSLRPMGQTLSRSQAPLPPTPPQNSNPEPTLTTGQRLKRVFINVRKKSVDSSRSVSQPASPLKKEKDRGRSDSVTSQWRTPSFPALSLTASRRSKSPAPSAEPQSPKRSRFSPVSSADFLRFKRATTPEPRVPPVPALPPPLPPKPSSYNISPSESETIKLSTEIVSSPEPSGPSVDQPLPEPTSRTDSTDATENVETSKINEEIENQPLDSIHQNDSAELPDTLFTEPTRRPERTSQPERNAEETEAWRKSDSTMRTVRVVGGSRTPRPLSIAESSHSGHTVTIGQGSHQAAQRFSIFAADPDNTTSEVESDDEDVGLEAGLRLSVEDRYQSQGDLSSSQLKSVHRRSLSVTLNSLRPRNDSVIIKEASSPFSEKVEPSMVIADNSSSYNDTDEEVGLSASSMSSTSTSSSAENPEPPASGHSFRGRLTAWTSIAKASQSSVSLVNSSASNDPQPSPLSPLSNPMPLQPQAKGFRQHAISMTNGLAKGLGKKAVDRLGRALGGGVHSSSSVNSAVSSISAFGSSSLLPNRLHSAQNSPASPSVELPHTAPVSSRMRRRSRATKQPSGSWSVSSSSASDNDAPSKSTGLYLGRVLRPPIAASGVVFGRPLAECVERTAVHFSGLSEHSDEGIEAAVSRSQDLERRRIPSIVLRCAQHLQKWGLQEEGLFRIPGRAGHANKLRQEFDTGADFDLVECGPGEIDPHAVSSIFRAYLRELPEPLLTRNLAPFFEAALTTENSMAAADEAFDAGRKAESDRSNFNSLRKAPSLSTLGLPMMSIKAPSRGLLRALRSLISQLPEGNRDVLRTVTELIWMTAKRSRQTKMPLSNLLLVFCPSLNMSPPLLKILCENDTLWDVPDSFEEGENNDADITVTAEHLADEEDYGVEQEPDDDEVEAENEFDATSFSTSEQGSISRDNSRDVPLLIGDDSATEDSSESVSVNTGPIDAALNATPPSLVDEVSHKEDIRSTAILEFGSVIPEQTELVFKPFPFLPPAASEALNTKAVESEDKEVANVKSAPTEEQPSSTEKGQSDLPFPRPLSMLKLSTPGSTQFPISGSVPNTPVTRTPKMSIFSSSSPDLAKLETQTLGRRTHRPSLKLMLRKRSISSLFHLSNATEYASAISAPSTEASPVVSSNAPPVLEIPLQHSPLKLGLEEGSATIAATFGGSGEPKQDGAIVASAQTIPPISLHVPPMEESESTSSFLDISRASSTSSAYSPTIFYTPPMNSRTLDPKPSQLSLRSSYSFLDLPEEGSEAMDDDWARSVLTAAELGVASGHS